MNFKKIMTVLASAAMFCSTVAFAAASGGTGGVFGDNTVINAPGSLDQPAANSLNDYIGSLNISTITNETIIEGEIEAVKTSSQPLYLGDNMYDTKSTFTKTQLPTVLASGEVDGDDSKDYEYNLKIDVPTSIVKYGEPEDNIDKAIIYADFSTDENYKLRIIFPTAVDVKELAGESITLFGRDFTFSEDEGDLSNESITLFEKSNTVRINSGESKVVEGHTISADIEDTNHATIYVDGISKNVNDEDWSGKIGGVDIYVKNIFASNYEGGQRYVQISLNAEKLVLEDTEEVERGTSSIDGTHVEIKPSGSKVREIIITVTPNDIELDDNDNVEYLGVGDYLIDPVFKTIKFSLDSVTPDLESDDRDYIEVKTTGDNDASIEFTNKAGGEYNFEFIDDGVLNFNLAKIVEDEYFITGSNEYTQIWQLEDVNGDSIRVKDQAEDSDTLELSVNEEKAELPLADGGVTTIISNEIGIFVPGINYIFTEQGALLNFTDGTVVNITEETPYNGGTFTDNNNDELGKVISIEIENPTTDLKLSLTDTDYTDDDTRYAVTRYGTYLEEDDGERIEIYYPEEAMSIDFHIGEITSSITSEVIPSEGIVSEVVVGGSCVNAEAARLLGSSTPVCGEAFTTLTGVGVNQAMIKSFTDTNGKVAVLVAGYETADTLRAVNHLKNNYQTMDLSPGVQIIV